MSPAGRYNLKYQWQRELKEKFGVRFRLIDRNTMRAAWGENVWVEHPFAITSIDFLKQDDVKATLHSADWDLVIVDEAHKMSAYAYESSERTKIDKTKRYQAGEVLARNTDHLLFLTATPHRGDDENFRLFLDLLRPGFFAQTDLLRESVARGDNPVFVRRLKEDMKTFDGRDIFPPRTVRTLKFRMTDREIELYNAVTRYVQHYYDQAREKRHITFAMLILQRRLTSSVHAILSSLERRREKLEEWLHLPEKIREDERFRGLRDLSEDEMEELAEADRWAIEERLEQITIADNIEDVREEVAQLEELIEMAKGVRSREIESKLVKLRDEILTGLGEEKLLVFTEHRDTLRYLKEKLEGWDAWVLDGEMVRIELDGETDRPYLPSFASALALSEQPRADLFALYQGWIDAMGALLAARLSHRFARFASRERNRQRWDALREYEAVASEIAKLRRAAARERQMNRQVDLNIRIRELEAQRAAALDRL